MFAQSKAALSAMAEEQVFYYVLKGGEIQKCKPSNKAANSTYRFIRADAAYRGRKSATLRNFGLSKAVG